MNLVLCFRRDQFMEELENEELNRKMCVGGGRHVWVMVARDSRTISCRVE